LIGYVVDASVAAKWCIRLSGETLVEESLHLRDEFTAGRLHLFVPDLFWPELGNIFWKAVRKERISGKLADEAIQATSDLGIPTFPSLPLLSDAFSIATRFHCTVYDCTYVALAVASGRPLVTADERLANTLAAHFPVRWLGSVG
jgi:predicted nucleic acid-binding protein